MSENEFELPPSDVTNTQLYVLVSALRKDVAQLRTESTATRAENAELREEVEKLNRKFDNSQAVVATVKWIAIVGGAIIALIEGIRRFANLS